MQVSTVFLRKCRLLGAALLSSGTAFFIKVNLFTLCISIGCSSLLFATNGRGQDLDKTEVTLSLHNGTLREALKQIERQSEFRFTYKEEHVAPFSNISLKKASRSVKESLDLLLKDTGISYRQVGNYIILTASQEPTGQADEIVLPFSFTVSGKVSDETGQPLPGVNVLEKGTTNGTTTDIDGRYLIAVSDKDVILVFSFIGYVSQEVAVNGQSVIDVGLVQDIKSLEEVVVVGYGTQKKADVTGSVASVSEEALQSRPVASFEDALQGRSSGVMVRQSSGDLDGRFSINIRGIGSVTGSNDPLIVVDGVPLFSTDFSTINPKDIASIDILKDASATAIYGSRAANGVVIVTTKKGRAGVAQFTFSTDIGFEEITKKYDVMSTEEQRQLFVEAFKNSNRDISIYDNPSHPSWQVDNDWQDLGTRTALRQNYNLGFSGGSEKTQFSGSASYLNREGTLVNTDLKNWSLRLNLSSQLNDWLKLTTNLTGSHQTQHFQQNDNWNPTGFRSLVHHHSYTPAYDEHGNLTAINTTAAPYFGANENPLINLLLPTREDNTTRLLGNTKLDVSLSDNLLLSGNLGADVVLGHGYTFMPVYSIGLFSNPEGSVTVPASQQINWVSDLTLTYRKDFGSHDVTALAGFSAQQFMVENTTTTGTGTVDNALNQLSNQTNFNASGTDVTSGLVSTFLRVNYGYEDKYLLTATVRRDGSSKFGPEKRYGVFPSGSVAWRLSEEPFLQSSSIDDLKLRVSYGLTGNQNIGDFAFITRAGRASYVFGNSVVVGNAPQNIGNPNLQWEATKQLDIGFDLAFLKGRIHTTLDYYDKQSEDLLVSTPIPLTSGVSQNPIVNLGSVKNTGFEFSVLSRNIVGPFSWTTDFNISHNKNRVIDIGTNSIGQPLEIPGESIPLSNQPANLTRSGHPVGAFWMYIYDGVWQLGQESEAMTWSGAVPGDPRYADLNNNGVFDVGDKAFVGNPHPKFFGGMDNTFTYKNLSLSIFLNFATGYKLYNTARNLFSRGVPFVQNFREVNGFWTTENPSNTVPRPSQGGNTTTLTTMVSTRFLEDADFLRIKNIRLSYQFPSSIIKGDVIKAARLTLTGTNLFTFTKYTGLDPEASSRESLLSAGIDYTPYPQVRLVSLGAQLTF